LPIFMGHWPSALQKSLGRFADFHGTLALSPSSESALAGSKPCGMECGLWIAGSLGIHSMVCRNLRNDKPQNCSGLFGSDHVRKSRTGGIGNRIDCGAWNSENTHSCFFSILGVAEKSWKKTLLLEQIPVALPEASKICLRHSLSLSLSLSLSFSTGCGSFAAGNTMEEEEE
jgi:hypothetical protein